jgi:hypothetical protein
MLGFFEFAFRLFVFLFCFVVAFFFYFSANFCERFLRCCDAASQPETLNIQNYSLFIIEVFGYRFSVVPKRLEKIAFW